MTKCKCLKVLFLPSPQLPAPIGHFKWNKILEAQKNVFLVNKKCLKDNPDHLWKLPKWVVGDIYKTKDISATI